MNRTEKEEKNIYTRQLGSGRAFGSRIGEMVTLIHFTITPTFVLRLCSCVLGMAWHGMDGRGRCRGLTAGQISCSLSH